MERFLRMAVLGALRRAQILAMLDDGHGSNDVAELLGMSGTTVRRVGFRYREEGLDSALRERPRPGQARLLKEKQEARIIAMVCSRPAADLSAFAALWSPHIFRWGFTNESPPSSPTFRADIANLDEQYALDQADLSAFANDLGKTCKLGKAVEGEDAETIMAWFGFTLTGRSIVIGRNGETVPEYELSDPTQNMVARSDPYGYRNRINSEKTAPWSRVKQLFR